MLNRAARYFPILEILGSHGIRDSAAVLEVGSGPIGLGEFRKAPFTGCDVYFPTVPRRPMTAVKCSAYELPFADRQFDAVVASDVLEHIHPEKRHAVIAECLRVARKLVIFGFPCGEPAHKIDEQLRDSYISAGKDLPPWLQEHMDHDFPTAEIFADVDGWSLSRAPNEHLDFHYSLMRLEQSRLLCLLFAISLKMFPGVLRSYLRRQNRAPAYRTIFVLTRAG